MELRGSIPLFDPIEVDDFDLDAEVSCELNEMRPEGSNPHHGDVLHAIVYSWWVRISAVVGLLSHEALPLLLARSALAETPGLAMIAAEGGLRTDLDQVEWTGFGRVEAFDHEILEIRRFVGANSRDSTRADGFRDPRTDVLLRRVVGNGIRKIAVLTLPRDVDPCLMRLERVD